MRPRLSRICVAACVPLLVVAGAGLGSGPAVADTRTFADDARTAGHMDIRRVSVTNERRLTVRVVVDDLQRRPGPSASAWLDTDPARSGPEFAIVSGLVDSDWQIARVRNWRLVGDPLSCPVEQGLAFRREVIRWTTGPRCLGSYSRVRVSVTTQGAGSTDHSPGRRTLHPRVARF